VFDQTVTSVIGGHNTGAAEIIVLEKYLYKSLTKMKIHYFGGL